MTLAKKTQEKPIWRKLSPKHPNRMCTGLIAATTMAVSRRCHSGTLNLSVAVMIPVFVAAARNTKSVMARVADAR